MLETGCRLVEIKYLWWKFRLDIIVWRYCNYWGGSTVDPEATRDDFELGETPMGHFIEAFCRE
jgi:hypothetical protein